VGQDLAGQEMPLCAGNVDYPRENPGVRRNLLNHCAGGWADH